MGLRKNYRNLTDAERDRFVQALYHVKSTGLVDRFANMHAMHFNMGIHRSSHFLPWHREFLLRFERALQAHHPDVTIPYWNSTVDTSPSNPLWDNSFLGQFNAAWGLERALGSGPLPTPQQVEANQGRGTYDAFWPELEHPIHNWPHVWVGGVMNSFPSPGDPVFYLHHCWIDLLWARWQRAHPGAPFVSSRPGAGLNDPLMEWPDRTPAHVLDHRALGYSYDFEQFSDAAFVWQSVPPEMEAGRSHAVTVTMRNIGTTTWTAGANPYRLGSQRPQDNLTWGLMRVDVPAAIAPGAEAVFRFTVTAPSDSGIYAFQWRMVQDLVEWFGEFTPAISVTVVRPGVVAVPDVREMLQAKAAQAIRDAGLNPRFTGSTGPGAWVRSQSPRAGSPVPLGSTVTLQLRTGPIP
jgi:tyrosinase